MTPNEALTNLHRAAEALPTDGPTRDALRESVRVLADAIAPKEESDAKPAK